MNITIKHAIVKNTRNKKLSLVLEEYLEHMIFMFFPVVLGIVVTEKSVTLPPAVKFNSLKLKDLYSDISVSLVIRKMQIKVPKRYQCTGGQQTFAVKSQIITF